MKIDTTSKSVNSKVLFKEINENLRDGIFTVDINWQNSEERDIFINFMHTAMSEFYEKGKIDQWRIQCNGKNNTAEDMGKGIFVIEVHYKQKNCLNTTTIKYTVREKENG